MAEYLKTDIKVGGVILFCVLLLTGLIFYVGGFKQLETQYIVRVLADSAYGVGKSSIVTYSGVKVGEVTSLRVLSAEEIRQELPRFGKPELTPDDIRVEMLLKVNSTAVLRQDSKAEVVGSGLVGDQIVNLTPGSFDAPVMPRDTILVGVELTGLGKLQKGIGKIDFAVLNTAVNNLSQASEKVNHTIERVDKFVAELERKDQVNKILDATDKIVQDLSRTVQESSPKITSAISNINDTSEKLKTEVDPILTNLRTLSEDLKVLVAENKTKLNDTVAQFNSTAVNFNQFSEKVRKYPWTILKKTKVAKEDEHLFPKAAGAKIEEESSAPSSSTSTSTQKKPAKKDKVFLFF